MASIKETICGTKPDDIDNTIRNGWKKHAINNNKKQTKKQNNKKKQKKKKKKKQFIQYSAFVMNKTDYRNNPEDTHEMLQSGSAAFPSRKHTHIILTPKTPLLYSKTGVYRGIHYFSYFCSKT